MPKVKKQSKKTIALNLKVQRSFESERRLYEVNKYELSTKQIKAGQNFDNEISTISFESCTNCNRSFQNLNVKQDGCSECNSANKRNKFTIENNMDVGIVPDELKDLWHIEQMLIARIHPVVSIYRISGAQYGSTGYVINFRQNIEEYIKELPLPLNKLTSTLVFNKKTVAGIAQFRVRAHKILQALLKLKEIDIYYK